MFFKDYPEVKVLMSYKKDGSMKRTKDFSFFEAETNKKDFLKRSGIERSVFAELVHGNKINSVNLEDAGMIIKKTDGLITKEKDLFLAITVADCLPVFLFDPENQIVGVVHCGWRGLASNILRSAVLEFKTDPKNILAGIGPGISDCHFEVKKDVAEIFGSEIKRGGKIFLDLKKIAEQQLLSLGVKNIEVSKDCTVCSDKYFSFRRDKVFGVQAALIGLTRKKQRVI